MGMSTPPTLLTGYGALYVVRRGMQFVKQKSPVKQNLTVVSVVINCKGFY